MENGNNQNCYWKGVNRERDWCNALLRRTRAELNNLPMEEYPWNGLLLAGINFPLHMGTHLDQVFGLIEAAASSGDGGGGGGGQDVDVVDIEIPEALFGFGIIQNQPDQQRHDPDDDEGVVVEGELEVLAPAVAVPVVDPLDEHEIAILRNLLDEFGPPSPESNNNNNDNNTGNNADQGEGEAGGGGGSAAAEDQQHEMRDR